ncbi:uncharacterized protein Z520_12341 [Fonsecaea multimorphosa CBS 102226]|uniref:Major facilitator superfamily (MFS) profile domain-containing protein n=1 Tax=Fonsecaea multimorphosa CBS 102226 TaxID=1442371 RepID=A0A0D2JFK4_9EURO|nr:uncharacterized protein Z520_12341 [Fonsecaea multimorphosa CBS 102226]KIX91952.1 hypothetical protein Z520_12341 [Fonsecaea multimorphosa CBS 102226]OAL17322.1 hypothetical protein AYO22_11764 [Fonsecaea multimorphosa]
MEEFKNKDDQTVASNHFELSNRDSDSELQNVANEKQLHGFMATTDTVPPGYYRSTYFLGSLFAIGMGLGAGVAGFGLAAPILSVIDADIGPSPYLTWVSIAYTLCTAVGSTLIGRLSDIFGRRYYFIGGTVLALLGSIVSATAQSINTLIGGTILIGLGACTQINFCYITAELVPMGARFWVVSMLYFFCVPGSGFGPAIAEAFVTRYPGVSWRGCYYLLICMNAVALLCWILFYWPPEFSNKHAGKRRIDFVKELDYVGILLYTAGLTLFLMGLSMGGDAVFPWKSRQTLSTLLVGAACLIALGFWVWLAKPKQPLIPKHLLTNRAYVAASISIGIGSASYYAFAIVWPMMVSVLYNHGDPMYGGYLSCIVGSCTLLGQICGGILARPIGKVKYQMTVCFFCGGVLLASMATCTPETKNRAIALLISACFFFGWTESVVQTLVTISIHDQQEIGTAGGIAASMRSAIATSTATIYTVTLSSRSRTTIGTRVPSAAIAAGLPASSVPALMEAFASGSKQAFAQVPGLTSAILATATTAYKNASASAYSTVFLATISFSALGLLLSFLLINVDDRMTNEITTTLGHKKGELVPIIDTRKELPEVDEK